MKIKHLLSKITLTLLVLFSFNAFSQVPVANFSISPVPICSGTTNIYQISDQSSNAPTAWSYTVRGGGGGPIGGQSIQFSVQNPTLSFNNPGTYTILLVSTNSSGQSVVVSKTIAVLPSPNANINPQNFNSCIGGAPVNITVTTGGGPVGGPVTYSWSTGSTSSVVSVSPSVTTVYSCVISSTNGCAVTRVSTVIIGTPTVTITSVPASICPGTTCTLTVNGSGPGPKVYTWSNATNGNITTSSVTGVFTATMLNSQGCMGVQTYTLGTSTTLSLTASSSPSILCAGNVATLDVSGASNYTWSNGASINNPTVNPTVNSSYTVIGQIGTCSGTAVYNLSVNLTPTVTVTSNPATICQGQSFTLSASGATSYTWNPGNITTSSVVVSPGSNVSYTVRGQNLGCPARNGTIALTVAPSPAINAFSSNTVACAGEAVALNAVGASSYTWSNGATSPLIIVYPTSSSVYSVVGVNSSNCSGTALISLIINECAGLEENLINSGTFIMYPNPAKEVVTLKSGTDLKLELMTITGQLIRTIQISNDSEVKLYGLKSGIYFIRSYGTEKTSTQKLIVE